MKLKSLIICAVAVIVAYSLVLTLRMCSSGKSTNLSTLQELSAPRAKSEPSVPLPSPDGSSIPKPDRAPDPFADARWFEAFLAPITFYGRVTDQYGAPIQGASVLLKANDNPERSGTTHQRTSDAAGNFSITGIRGLDLYVEVSKPGYYRVKSEEGVAGSYGGYDYGINASGNGIHTPLLSNPVTFVLHKPGLLEPLVIQSEKRPRVPKDGTPVKLLLNPDEPNGIHFIEVQCWTSDAGRNVKNHYDWRFKVSVPNGGLVTRIGEFAFEAPMNGYEPNDENFMPQTLQGRQWQGSVDRSFFVRFNDDVYARVNLRMIAHGAHYVVFSSYLNPKSGSRNLEADPTN